MVIVNLTIQNRLMIQKFEIGPEEATEKIEIPDFGQGPTILVHDFARNLTALFDGQTSRCFLKDLNRTQIKSPESWEDLKKVSLSFVSF